MNTLAGGSSPAKQLGRKQFLRVLLGTSAILMVPLMAMQFTREVNWTPSDFVVAALLLGGTGMLFEVATTKIRTRKARIITSAVIALGFLFVWAELAVGIVRSPFAGS